MEVAAPSHALRIRPLALLYKEASESISEPSCIRVWLPLCKLKDVLPGMTEARGRTSLLRWGPAPIVQYLARVSNLYEDSGADNPSRTTASVL